MHRDIKRTNILMSDQLYNKSMDVDLTQQFTIQSSINAGTWTKRGHQMCKQTLHLSTRKLDL